MVALATLTAAADQTSAMSFLTALPNQAEVTRIGAEALAAWAHRLYAGPGYWNPLRPDLLAEQHLADTAQLHALAAAAARLAAGQPGESGLLTQLLAELTRGAPNQPAVRMALDELLGVALPRIVYLAIADGHPGLADLASLALQLTPRPDLAAPLVDQMPEGSVRLAALAAALTSQQVTHYRAYAVGGEPDAASRLAASLTNLSGLLGDLGRREEALAASQESVTIRRELAAVRPDAFRPDLALSLNNLAKALADLGRREEALAATQEAAEAYRELAAARPDAFRPALATSVNNLSVLLGDLGRREEALAASQESVTIHRELAAARPDAFRPGHLELAAARPDAFRPGLAGSLNNLSVRLRDLGRREEALAAIQEAVTIRRELAAARPDAFRPDLADSLADLAVNLAELGRWEEALAATQEATEVYRELAAVRPDAFRPALALSLNNLSVMLGDLGRREEALAASAEATGIYRELAARWPDAYYDNLKQSLQVAARLERGEDPGGASPQELEA